MFDPKWQSGSPSESRSASPTTPITSQPSSSPTKTISMNKSTENQLHFPSEKPTFFTSTSPSSTPSIKPTITIQPTERKTDEPSSAPTTTPTVSSAPTTTPTVSSVPTVSSAPTGSPAPTATPFNCSANENGVIGTIPANAAAVSINYKYSVETMPNISARETISPIEDAINDVLLSLIGCGDGQSFQKATIDGMVGLSAQPADVIQSDGECEVVLDESNDCTVVQGTLTIWVVNDSTDVKERVLDAIKGAMDNDELVSASPGIVHIHYIGETNSQSANVEANSDVERGGNGFSTGFAVIASSVTAVCVLAAIVCRRRGDRDEGDESDQSMGEISDMEDSV